MHVMSPPSWSVCMALVPGAASTAIMIPSPGWSRVLWTLPCSAGSLFGVGPAARRMMSGGEDKVSLSRAPPWIGVVPVFQIRRESDNRASASEATICQCSACGPLPSFHSIVHDAGSRSTNRHDDSAVPSRLPIGLEREERVTDDALMISRHHTLWHGGAPLTCRTA